MMPKRLSYAAMISAESLATCEIKSQSSTCTRRKVTLPSGDIIFIAEAIMEAIATTIDG